MYVEETAVSTYSGVSIVANYGEPPKTPHITIFRVHYIFSEFGK